MKFGRILLLAGASFAIQPTIASAQELQSSAAETATAGNIAQDEQSETQMPMIPPPIVAVPTPAPAIAATPVSNKERGSFYVQCDGNPNNTTAGETAARLIGALTLLSLFAPDPEPANPAKRQFGVDGVAACSMMIDGEKAEGNPYRRMELITARALHQIEAKNYMAAIADISLARDLATAEGYMDDPYFRRSAALSFTQIEGAALLRMNQPERAQELTTQFVVENDFAFLPVITTNTYSQFLRESNEAEDKLYAAKARIFPIGLIIKAAREEELGRFAAAAEARKNYMMFLDSMEFDNQSSLDPSLAAVSYALAGNWEEAEKLDARSRKNMETRINAGKPEDNRASIIEVQDLYSIIKKFHEGDVLNARRTFAARSQWVAASFGSVMKVNAMLREGAAEVDLFGGLSKNADALWEERRNQAMAKLLATDEDNKTLFFLIEPLSDNKAYEAMSKNVWRTQKSKILGKEKLEKTDAYLMSSYGSNFQARYEAFLLHAALTSKERGFSGFLFYPVLTKGGFALTRFGNAGDPNIPEQLFIRNEDVIAELAPVIPDPETLKARKSSRK